MIPLKDREQTTTTKYLKKTLDNLGIPKKILKIIRFKNYWTNIILKQYLLQVKHHLQKALIKQ